MSLDLHHRRLRDRYDTVFRQCVSLNTELHKLVPLARQMHLLSANAVSSAARAGSEGDAFRVLTQDIQLLGDEVSDCIDQTQNIINEIVLIASNLAKLMTSFVSYCDTLARLDGQNSVTPPKMFSQCMQTTQISMSEMNISLGKAIRELSTQLTPLKNLVNKGEYLAVFSSVEAASAGQHGVSFEAVAKMLRELVTQLGTQSASQHSLLRDLIEGVEQLQIIERNRQYES